MTLICFVRDREFVSIYATHFEELELFSEEGRGTHQQNVAYTGVLPGRLEKPIQFLRLAPASFIKRPKLRPLLLTDTRSLG